MEHPAVGVEVYAEQSPGWDFLASLLAELRHRFNLDLDLSPFYEACGDDPMVGPLIDRRRGLRPGHPNSLYEYLVIGITLQNATVRRSIQMMQALLHAHGTLLTCQRQALWCFWPPGGLVPVSEEHLRRLKVGYRARFLKRIDDAFAAGAVDEMALRGADLNAQRRTLLGLHGVGPATTGYLLADIFHRWEVLDHISPWEQRIVSRLLFATEPEHPAPAAALLDRLAVYGPHRQLALHYLWEDLWWRHASGDAPWLDPLIRT